MCPKPAMCPRPPICPMPPMWPEPSLFPEPPMCPEPVEGQELTTLHRRHDLHPCAFGELCVGVLASRNHLPVHSNCDTARGCGTLRQGEHLPSPHPARAPAGEEEAVGGERDSGAVQLTSDDQVGDDVGGDRGQQYAVAIVTGSQ